MTWTAWELITLAVPNRTVSNAQQSLQASIRHSLLVANRPDDWQRMRAGLRQVDFRVWCDVPMAACGQHPLFSCYSRHCKSAASLLAAAAMQHWSPAVLFHWRVMSVFSKQRFCIRHPSFHGLHLNSSLHDRSFAPLFCCISQKLDVSGLRLFQRFSIVDSNHNLCKMH